MYVLKYVIKYSMVHMCEIAHALRKQENIYCVLVCTLEVDNISFAHE